jgi:glycosyltransferase involved in cell wall biosynthesis
VIVAIDARPAAFSQKTGVGYYTWNLLRMLPAVDPATDYVAWYLDARGPRRRVAPPAARLRERRTRIPSRWFEMASERWELPRLEWFVRFDVLFAPNLVPPPSRKGRLVVTVHDLAFRRFPSTAPHGTRRWLSRFERSLARADTVITVSEATKRDLEELYGIPPSRATVVPLGVDPNAFRPASAEEVARVRARFGIDGPYLLYLGGLEPRKNLPPLLQAFAGLPADVRPSLVVAGSGVAWNPEGPALLKEAMAALPERVRSRVRLTGYVGDTDKVALLGGAEALVYPSLYEGFGLPVIEAMACGTPVLTSDVSALPEVAGGAALLVDPRDVGSIRDGIARLLTDEPLRRRLKEAGVERASRFSWERTARLTAEVLREAR